MERIVLTPGTLDGAPRIRGRRISVEHVAAWFMSGMSIPAIAMEYRLDCDDIEAALRFAMTRGRWFLRRNGDRVWHWVPPNAPKQRRAA